MGEAAVLQQSSQREEWLQKRQEGIGGSDAAAVLGLSPWKSPLTLWSEKVGLVTEPNLDELEYIEWGKVLEEPIARKYEAVTGRQLINHGPFAIRFSEERPWMHCTIDREIPATQPGVEAVYAPMNPPAPGPGDLSIKNAGAYKAKDWEEEAPLVYQIQLQHELIVTGMQWGSFAVLIGGNKFGWLDEARNERFCSYLIEKEEEFWDRVKRGDPPEADGSDSTKEILLRLYPKDSGESIALPVEAYQWAEERESLKATIDKAEAEVQQIDNKIKAAIGKASIGLLPDGSGFSWKFVQRKGYTVAPTEYRQLRRIKNK